MEKRRHDKAQRNSRTLCVVTRGPLLTWSCLATSSVLHPRAVGCQVQAEIQTEDLEDDRAASLSCAWGHGIVHGQRSQRSKFDQWPDIPGGSVNLSRICQGMSIRSLRTSGETIHGSSGANNPETIDELQLLDIPGHSARSPGTSARGDVFWRSEIVGRVVKDSGSNCSCIPTTSLSPWARSKIPGSYSVAPFFAFLGQI